MRGVLCLALCFAFFICVGSFEVCCVVLFSVVCCLLRLVCFLHVALHS